MDDFVEDSPLQSLTFGLSKTSLASAFKDKPGPSRIDKQTKQEEEQDKQPMDKRLLSSGLRVSTPPTGRLQPKRLQLVPTPDENNPPATDSSSPLLSPPTIWKSKRSHQSLDEVMDNNSQDSGCAMSSCPTDDSSSSFRFAQPFGFAPKRNSSMESPRRSLTFLSENSQSSVDDGVYLELYEDEDEQPPLPLDMDLLISGQILTKTPNSPSPMKRPFKELPSDDNATPLGRRSFRESDDFTLKRPLLFRENTEAISPAKTRLKRFKTSSCTRDSRSKPGTTLFDYGFWKHASPLPPEDKVSLPSSEIDVKLAVQRSTQEELIGDFTRPHVLPLTTGKHGDLKTISCETLAKVLDGDYSDSVNSYRIIDCRYPYEFSAGHIKGAENLYTCDHILDEFINQKSPLSTPPSDKRDIVIFHCEFSYERGPFLTRYLRKKDRAKNTHKYPSLKYPEIYLLNGGYSEFFQKFKQHCDPQAYKKMDDPSHSTEYKQFRAKFKTWGGPSNRKSVTRSLSRLM